MTKKILVTGGTVFVSKFVATYFKNHIPLTNFLNDVDHL